MNNHRGYTYTYIYIYILQNDTRALQRQVNHRGLTQSLHTHEVLEADPHNLPSNEYFKNKRKIRRSCYGVFIVNGM